jgi:phosphoribosyl 1,2-cyclic phosphate phosphodiesterase
MGVPMIRCGCDVCRSKDPRDNRTRSSIYLQAEDLSWIVDTGPEFRIQALRERIESLDAVLNSHAHADHVIGLDDLRLVRSEEKTS